MADGVVRVAPGRHTRRIELENLRRVSLVALIVLVVQYGLGIILNLYIAIPASDAHAGIMQEIINGPAMLTLHALLGLALIGAALLLTGVALLCYIGALVQVSTALRRRSTR